MLLTEDKDFGDLAFFYGNRSSGIFLLRAHDAGTDVKVGAIANVLEAYEEELVGDPPYFVVVRPGRPTRARRIGDMGTER